MLKYRIECGLEYLIMNELAINHEMQKLSEIIYDWMKSILYNMTEGCGLWLDTSSGPGFEWVLINDVEFQGPCVGVIPFKDKAGNITGYNIYNYFYDFRHVNIIIRDGVVSWFDSVDTEYRDFTMGQMRSLFEKIRDHYPIQYSKLK